MAVNFQNLQNLASVTSLAQLRLDGEGQLEKRSALGTLGHRIMDAFRSLSAEGRSAIASRNTALFSAMLDAVNASRTNGEARMSEAEASLSKTLDRLSAANTASYGKALVARIMTDPNVAALPENSLLGLKHGLVTIANENPRSEWQSQMNALRDTFLGVEPEGFSLERGVQKFGDGLRTLFFGKQQNKMENFGLHRSFYTDIDRSFIKDIGGTPIDPAQFKKDIPNESDRRTEFCRILTDFLRGLSDDEDVQTRDMRVLPFLSMAGTQDGTASICPILSRDCGHKGFETLLSLGIGPKPGGLAVDTSITRDSANLRHILISTHVSMGFVTGGNPQNPPALKLEAGITMRINLDAEPTMQEVNGKQVFLPSFTLENASTRFTTEGL